MPYWTEQLDIQRRVALAWVAYAEGKKDEGISSFRRQQTLRMRPTSPRSRPGRLAPARELLGDMLLDAGRPEEALVAFEATTKKEPNRFRGLYGAGRGSRIGRR